jgi:hypothetical protein
MLLAELLVNVGIFKSHVISLSNLGVELFQSKIPSTVGITREVRETINIKLTCSCGNNNCIINHVHT